MDWNTTTNMTNDEENAEKGEQLGYYIRINTVRSFYKEEQTLQIKVKCLRGPANVETTINILKFSLSKGPQSNYTDIA